MLGIWVTAGAVEWVVVGGKAQEQEGGLGRWPRKDFRGRGGAGVSEAWRCWKCRGSLLIKKV